MTAKTHAMDLASGDALVIGASRGVGLALTEALLTGPAVADDTPAAGPPRRVFASYRGESVPETLQALSANHGARLQPVHCELGDDDAIKALGHRLADQEARLILTLHAAGILHEDALRPEKALSQARRTHLSRLFEINAIAPLLVAQATLPLMPRKEFSHFAALSAMVGSISDNQIGGWYGYRASKAALNQFLKTLAIEARRTHPGLCVTSIHPGTTDTGLSKPFQGNVAAGKLYSPAQSAARILKVVLEGTPDSSGRFMNWTGQPLAW